MTNIKAQVLIHTKKLEILSAELKSLEQELAAASSEEARKKNQALLITKLNEVQAAAQELKTSQSLQQLISQEMQQREINNLCLTPPTGWHDYDIQKTALQGSSSN